MSKATIARPEPAKAPAGRSPAPQKRRRNVPWTLRLAPYLFLLPNMAIFGLFTIYPAINGVNISLYASPNGRIFRWVGIGNYETILSDPTFWQAARATAIYTVAYVLLSVVIATLLAVLVNSQGWGKTFFRGVFFVPVLISPVVVGLVWGWILQRQGGLLNTALGAVGIGEIPWLIDQNWALVAVIAVGVWMQAGFYMLILLAGLQGIDPSLYEAARMDGASSTKQFTAITMPLLQPTMVVVVVLGTIHGFQAFDFIFTLTGGGPTRATTLMVQYIYDNGFVSPIRYGIAAAGGVILFVVIFLVTILNYFVSRRREAV
ncbi:MAG: sugar ABC transporter permease [bacterium]|nr:sugar ABC transporter permease [bacterium]